MLHEPTPALGLERGQVRVVPYDPRWPQLFEEEAERLRAHLGSRLLDLQHFGSTAVPGLSAKPVLDMLAGVSQLSEALLAKPVLEGLGYEHASWAGVPDHEIFGRGLIRTHLLHLVEYRGDQWRENLWFRDRLRADPGLAAAYGELKQHLAAQFPSDRGSYTERKTAFIQRIRATTPGDAA